MNISYRNIAMFQTTKTACPLANYVSANGVLMLIESALHHARDFKLHCNRDSVDYKESKNKSPRYCFAASKVRSHCTTKICIAERAKRRLYGDSRNHASGKIATYA
ncbi:hypothetical protein PUN28_004514 [Cardiocondyla obscurior]|uniref:Uncharacterized protein n=1 Tax=Cardiocondyla obscurior TaxID=286306 RepID=A0AAW2GDX1_9HYME